MREVRAFALVLGFHRETEERPFLFRRNIVSYLIFHFPRTNLLHYIMTAMQSNRMPAQR